MSRRSSLKGYHLYAQIRDSDCIVRHMNYGDNVDGPVQAGNSHGTKRDTLAYVCVRARVSLETLRELCY